MQNLYNDLKELLLQHEPYIIDDKLNKPKIEDDGLNLDVGLLTLLLQNTKLKKHFFQDVHGVMVFDKVKFPRFINNKQFLPDCYTEFKNKIGLTINGKFLTESKEVVLDFPYKDCVLQGCQDQEDSKRDEVFFNETLAPDDIDMLLEPKVLTSFKKYDANGCHEVTDVTIQDNLIIKGNNLLALHSLNRIYRGKVKLIYIDPPYNTGNDGFKYNDKFNHSTWLTFMKNRLEIARELLREDGVIFVQCDYNEVHYLKVLMDCIFGNENFVNEIIWKRKFGNANETRRLGTAYDNILLYSKSNNYAINLIKEKESKHVQEYIKSRFTRVDATGKHKGKLWMPYPLANPGNPTKNLSYEYKGYSSPLKGWRMTKDKLMALDDDERLYFPEDKSQRIQEKKFLDDYDGQPVDSLWVDIFVINSQSDEAYNFDGQKPEDLLKRILLIATNQGDIVVDYHLGSGTTAAVAHKMGRRYIGIEQMDYIDELVITRLKNVIGIHKDNSDQLIIDDGYQDYDTSGISKAVNWCGGGSFIYCELMQNNQIWVDKINHANNSNQLIQLWKLMQDKAQLSYKVDINQMNANINKFECLSFEEQKRFLIEILDKNQLYVNYTEIDDVAYSVSDTDKPLNSKFYSMK